MLNHVTDTTCIAKYLQRIFATTQNMQYASRIYSTLEKIATMKEQQAKAIPLLRNSIRPKIDVPQIRCNREVMIIICV